MLVVMQRQATGLQLVAAHAAGVGANQRVQALLTPGPEQKQVPGLLQDAHPRCKAAYRKTYPDTTKEIHQSLSPREGDGPSRV